MQASANRSNSFASNAPDDPLKPLRTMADRVGKEVEKFAERVDHWHTYTEKSDDPTAKYRTTLRMVNRFKEYAESTVKALKKRSGEENQALFARSVRRRVENLADAPRPSIEVGGTDNGSNFDSESELSPVGELRQWQAEASTWELLETVIDLYHPEPGVDDEETRRNALEEVGNVDRYSPESAIWDRFVLEEDQAKEKILILKWLEATAEKSESTVETIVEQLQEESGKSLESWSAGWLDTRMQIKQAKRLGGYGQPLSDDFTAIQSSNRSGRLVSQLDPDAPLRQRRPLEQSDELYERGLWLLLWEMLRRGRPWKEIADWCRDHNEAWRAVSMGFAGDMHSDARTNLGGQNVGLLWRRMCLMHARASPLDYEAAVFGLLGGDVKSVEKITRTWNDLLYAKYNALLLTKFDLYLAEKYPERVSLADAQKFPSIAIDRIGGWDDTTIPKVLDSLKTNRITAAQARSPMKLIQASLIGRTFKDLAKQIGIAISQLTLNDTRSSKVVISQDEEKAEPCYSRLATDPHALRVAVHIFLILRRGLDALDVPSESVDELFIENIIASYIEVLRLSHRIDAIPVYAAQLSKRRRIFVLSRILPDIRHAKEQKSFLKLMLQYKIEAVDVISEYYDNVLKASSIADENLHISRYEILQPTGKAPVDNLWPGYRIKDDFLDLSLGKDEEALIEALHWFTLLDADRTPTFMALTEVTKHLLLNGRLGAVLRISSQMNIEAISRIKTTAYCGYSLDFSDEDAIYLDKQALTESLRAMGRGKRLAFEPDEYSHRAQVEEFRSVSQTYNELLHIAHVLELLQDYRQEEIKHIASQAEGKKGSTKKLKQIFDALDDTIDFLITDFLKMGADDGQDQQFSWIRGAYVPEIVLAYNACVQSCAHFITREVFIKSSDLANKLASDICEPVQNAFLATGRMEELIQALAATAHASIRLREIDTQSKKRKRSGGRGGETSPAKRPRGSRGETTRIWC